MPDVLREGRSVPKRVSPGKRAARAAHEHKKIRPLSWLGHEIKDAGSWMMKQQAKQIAYEKHRDRRSELVDKGLDWEIAGKVATNQLAAEQDERLKRRRRQPTKSGKRIR